jgi:hypothetical protein
MFLKVRMVVSVRVVIQKNMVMGPAGWEPRITVLAKASSNLPETEIQNILNLPLSRARARTQHKITTFKMDITIPRACKQLVQGYQNSDYFIAFLVSNYFVQSF